jgi:glycine cleavage system H protein
VSYDPETSVGIVGITDYAQKALGDVVFVELPSEGTEVAQGGESPSQMQWAKASR